MRIHLESMLHKEFLQLSYIVRPIAPPATFHNLTHELESVIVNDGSTAESRRDSKLVYSILYANTTDTAALSYMEDNNDLECGRQAWFSIESLYEGSGNNERLISEIQSNFSRQSYTMNGYGSALSLTKRLFVWYKELADRGSMVQEVDKLRHLRRIINVPMAAAPWYLNKWRDAVDLALQEHSENGTALRFVQWTTKLVNGEATYKTDSKSKSARISSASTGGGGSASGGDFSGGEDESNSECGSVESLSSNNNKKKKSTRSVSFAQTDDEFSGGEDETDGNSSSSEDDASSTSSDGSGDF